MGMFLYVLMAIYAGVGWAFQRAAGIDDGDAISTTGAIFTFISLVTGSLWGRPAWGVWWGLGRHADLDPDSDVSIHRIHLAAIVD